MVLTRIDNSKNERRFYRMDITPGLFGDWGLVREWGRIGRGVKSVRTGLPVKRTPKMLVLSCTWRRRSAATSSRSETCQNRGGFVLGFWRC